MHPAQLNASLNSSVHHLNRILEEMGGLLQNEKISFEEASKQWSHILQQQVQWGKRNVHTLYVGYSECEKGFGPISETAMSSFMHVLNTSKIAYVQDKTKVVLENCRLTASAWRAFAAGIICGKVNSIFLKRCQFVDSDGYSFHELKGYLVCFKLMRVKTDSQFLINLSQFVKNNELLKTLVMDSCELENKDIRVLSQALSKNWSIQKLVLDWNDFDNKGALYLANVIQKNRNLRFLSLQGTPIGNLGIMGIANGMANSGPLTLSLGEDSPKESKIKNETFSYLIEAGEKLQCLILEGDSKISCMKVLKAALKNEFLEGLEMARAHISDESVSNFLKKKMPVSSSKKLNVIFPLHHLSEGVCKQLKDFFSKTKVQIFSSENWIEVLESRILAAKDSSKHLLKEVFEISKSNPKRNELFRAILSKDFEISSTSTDFCAKEDSFFVCIHSALSRSFPQQASAYTSKKLRELTAMMMHRKSKEFGAYILLDEKEEDETFRNYCEKMRAEGEEFATDIAEKEKKVDRFTSYCEKVATEGHSVDYPEIIALSMVLEQHEMPHIVQVIDIDYFSEEGSLGAGKDNLIFGKNGETIYLLREIEDNKGIYHLMVKKPAIISEGSF